MGTGDRVSFRAAAKLLAARDPVMARLVRDGPAPRIPLWTESNFESLVRGIVFQQLARPAAVAILGRLVDAADGDLTPDTVLPLTDATLRQVGLSARIRRGYGVAYGIPTPTEKELEPLGEKFRPYRSTAAWYCWMAEAVLAGRKATLPIADDPILRAHGRKA